MEAGEKVGGNRKTGYREATGVERGEGGGRDGEMLGQKKTRMKDRERSHEKPLALNIIKWFKNKVPHR